MHRTYTTIFVVITAAILILACVLFAIAEGGHAPPPSSEALISTSHQTSALALAATPV